jgi:hypothetical protein
VHFEKLQNPLKHFVTGEREKNEKLETLKPVSSYPFSFRSHSRNRDEETLAKLH